MKSISIDEVLKINDVNIIDVRETYEFKDSSIPGAINIPLTGLVMNYENFLEKTEKYYIICQAGGRSMRACILLEEKGFDVTQIEGGISEYIKSKIK